MATWKLRFPQITQFLFYELRRLVLGEFMDDLELGGMFANALGIEFE